MRNRIMWCSVVFIMTSTTCLPQAKPLMGRMGEGFLRKRATTVVVPMFPADAVKAHKVGVAVAEIEVDAGGHVTAATVLESPTESIAQSMRNALLQWQFRPVTMADGTRIMMMGKVTFYFVFHKGRYVVLDPTEKFHL